MDDEPPAKRHPFVRVGGFFVGLVSKRRAKSKQKKADAAQLEQDIEDGTAEAPPREKKKQSLLGRLLRRPPPKEDDDDDDSDGGADGDRKLEEEDGNVSDWDGTESEQESEMYDGEEEEEEDDYLDAFQLGQLRQTAYEKEPIERLGPEDLKELEETMHRMNPKYKKAENLILEDKLERAVNERLARLRKANKYNALIAFGAPGRQIPLNLGNIKVPTLIQVTGHHGAGGNLGINGIYERYPDNHHGRPVYQKYLERDEFLRQPQKVRFRNGHEAWALQDAEDEDGARTFPTIHDTPRTKLAMKHTMLSVKVLPAQAAEGSVGHLRFVDQSESWFIYFDDLLGAWCIGPKPGSGAVFAKCYGTDEAIPDCLGPERWQVFDVGQRKWYTHMHLRTLKGGAVSSAMA